MCVCVCVCVFVCVSEKMHRKLVPGANLLAEGNGGMET